MVVIHIANIDRSLIGGVQIAVPQMVKAQSRHATVGFINTHGDCIDGVTMLHLSSGEGVRDLPPPFNRPDLVVFHEVYRFEFIKIYKMLRREGIPYVIIPHGCLSREAQKRKRLKKLSANILFFRSFMKGAKCIQYLSPNEVKLSAFSKYPHIVYGNGVDIPTLDDRRFEGDNIRFVYIGRMEIVTKGLDLLLGAVKQSEGTMRKLGATLEIYGPEYNGEHRCLRELADKYGISDLVRIDKEKMGEEKKRILLSSDCFIQASRTEAMPLGPIEALSYGLPCIVSRGVGLGDVVESYGAGLQCDTSADGISIAINKFMASYQDAKKMSESAIKLVCDNFDRNRFAEETVKGYCQLIKNNH